MILIPPFIENYMNLEAYLEYCGPNSTDTNKHAERICDAMSIYDYYKTNEHRDDYYYSLMRIMETQPRIALYIPFEDLRNAPVFFGSHYISAWRACLCDMDKRSDFGTAQYDGAPDLVIKAFHLLPWLIKYGYVGGREIIKILNERNCSLVVRQCVRECIPLMTDLELKYLNQIKDMIHYDENDVPQPETPKGEIKDIETTMLSYPAGPFSNNLDLLSISIEKWPDKGNIALYGGAVLKGYSRIKGDYRMRQVKIGVKFMNAQRAYICTNTAWACRGHSDEKLQRKRVEMISSLLGNSEMRFRREIVNSLEHDLLLGGLLKTGMARAYPDDLSIKTRTFRSIDGASAFYDDRYRRIATELFAKYVWLPKPQT